MIISVTKERYDAYWDDFDEETSYYWVTNPRVARRITRLETKVEASSDRAIVMYNVLQAVKYIIIPLTLFIIPLALGGHTQQWIGGGIVGLIFAGIVFGITYFVDWVTGSTDTEDLVMAPLDAGDYWRGLRRLVAKPRAPTGYPCPGR